MNQEMTTEELAGVYDKLVTFAQEGKEEQAKTYLSAQYARMPQALQREITTRLFFEAVAQEADEIQNIAAIQEEGLKAIEIMEQYLEEQKKAGKA